MILFVISFIAGVLTVLAPCILPLLPVIVGGSLSGGGINKKKALTIILSLGVSVILFTLLLKVSTLFINIPEQTWTWISGGLIIFIGFTSIFPAFWEGEWMAGLNSKANILLGSGDQKHSFWGDVIVGGALGPVFSTCSPTYFIILATVLPVSPVKGIVYLLTYTIGLCLSLLVVSIIGQKIMSGLGYAADSHGWVKKGFGILFILVGIAILTGYDKKIQTDLLNGGIFDVTRVEQKLLELNETKTTATLATSTLVEDSSNKTDISAILKQKSQKYPVAPEISTPDGFVNTDGKPITLAELKGKVVLLDIWTYSCINCRRTLPYVEAWYEKYKDEGLVVIGLHTPEFSFEKVQSNVEQAVKDLGITYPVVLDNDYSTWNAYGNQYWPRKYLIDMDGYIIYDHIGEGNYGETEKAIQFALEERTRRLNMKDTVAKDVVPDKSEPLKVNSPETYFGSNRNQYLANGQQGAAGIQSLTIPTKINSNVLYLGGTWNFSPEYAENSGVADIQFNYFAKNVYIVASSDAGIDISVYIDGKFLKTVTVKGNTLYTLVSGTVSGGHLLEIKIPKSGLKAFTFTFG